MALWLLAMQMELEHSQRHRCIKPTCAVSHGWHWYLWAI